jgi:hypothetical protein
LLAHIGLSRTWNAQRRTAGRAHAVSPPLSPSLPAAPAHPLRPERWQRASPFKAVLSAYVPVLFAAAALAALGWVLASATLATTSEVEREAAETSLPPFAATTPLEPGIHQAAITALVREPVVPPRARTERPDPPLPPRTHTIRVEPVVPPVPVVKDITPPADARLPFLPGWVESTEGSRVWSGPEEGARLLRHVRAGTRLRVLGAKQARLRVDFSDGEGWVAVSGVVPAAANGAWLRSEEKARIWASADERWPLFLLPAASQLHVEDETVENGRVQVHAYDQYGRPLIDGWVLREGLQPIEAPGWATRGARPAPNANIEKLIGDRQAFIEKVGAAARQASKSTGIPASVTVAQAILESSWGQSRLAREANNYFGIKALSGIGPAGVVWMPTIEVVDGVEVRVLDVFRAYHSLDQSVREKHRFLATQPIYRSALQARDDPVEFTYRIWQAGYSTDPDYVSKVVSLIRQYDLTRFDQ